jgi:hypothetical protein
MSGDRPRARRTDRGCGGNAARLGFRETLGQGLASARPLGCPSAIEGRERAGGQGFRNWPSGRGFERWYGFLGAETDQWYPQTQLGFFAVAGSSLYVGRQPGEPVTDDYPGEPPHQFTGGTLKLVAVNVSGEPFTDLEHHAVMPLKHR